MLFEKMLSMMNLPHLKHMRLYLHGFPNEFGKTTDISSVGHFRLVAKADEG
jgi:hypothetical protein